MYDFTSILDRRGKDAMAYSSLGSGIGLSPEAPQDGFDPIPMWVADMNFPTPPCVVDAIMERASHPAFGYFDISNDYYDSIIRWHSLRNAVDGMLPEHIGYQNGLLGGLISALSCFASHGDPVLVHSPTYIGFTKSISNVGYRIVLSDLVVGSDDQFHMDYDDMEKKIVANNIHVAVLCSPHNPTGRVWTPQELDRAMDIFRKHDCMVISDEIWSDIILPGFKHTPTQSVSADARSRTVALYAPSKTFNIAGLVGAYHVIYNKPLRDRVEAASSKSHYNDMNVLSMHALVGAYSVEGQRWLDELLDTIDQNIAWACSFIDKHFPGVAYSRPQGTYMLFIDVGRYCEEHGVDVGQLVREGWRVGVAWQDGRPFNGPNHIRINLASPLSMIQDAFYRLDRYVFNQ